MAGLDIDNPPCASSLWYHERNFHGNPDQGRMTAMVKGLDIPLASQSGQLAEARPAAPADCPHAALQR